MGLRNDGGSRDGLLDPNRHSAIVACAHSQRKTGVMRVSDLLRMLNEDGWFLVATRGSHRQFKHPVKPGRVTVPGKPADDLAPGTLNSILKQSGMKK
jgi:predicted RNA binding protein YcfA (HicA-like mRNA interferase family)